MAFKHGYKNPSHLKVNLVQKPKEHPFTIRKGCRQRKGGTLFRRTVYACMFVIPESDHALIRCYMDYCYGILCRAG